MSIPKAGTPQRAILPRLTALRENCLIGLEIDGGAQLIGALRFALRNLHTLSEGPDGL